MNIEEAIKILNIVSGKEKGVHVYQDVLSRAIETVLQELNMLEKENTDLKDLYIRIAKHQDKLGHFELSEYMLAQIEATPTFTTWEEYTTWVSKDKIREIIKELDIDIERNKRRKTNNNTEGNLSMLLISYDPEIIKMRLLKLLEE